MPKPSGVRANAWPTSATDQRHDGQREADLRADAIEDAAGHEEHDRVRQLKGNDDARVVELRPADLLLEIRRENAEHLPIHVVDRRREKQQAGDVPAKVADRPH